MDKIEVSSVLRTFSYCYCIVEIQRYRVTFPQMFPLRSKFFDDHEGVKWRNDFDLLREQTRNLFVSLNTELIKIITDLQYVRRINDLKPFSISSYSLCLEFCSAVGATFSAMLRPLTINCAFKRWKMLSPGLRRQLTHWELLLISVKSLCKKAVVIRFSVTSPLNLVEPALKWRPQAIFVSVCRLFGY